MVRESYVSGKYGVFESEAHAAVIKKMTPMRTRFFHLCLIVLSSIWCCACSSDIETRDPKTLPYTLEFAGDLGIKIVTGDLDGDGQDEIVEYETLHTKYPGRSSILLTKQDGTFLDQINYPGQVLKPHFLDLDDDNFSEIVVPFVRNDSLFAGFVNADGQKLFDFFLISREPVRVGSGVIPWFPDVVNFHATDLDADGHNELITVFNSERRGVLVHSILDGRSIGKEIVGAYIYGSLLGNFDDDSETEIVLYTISTTMELV